MPIAPLRRPASGWDPSVALRVAFVAGVVCGTARAGAEDTRFQYSFDAPREVKGSPEDVRFEVPVRIHATEGVGVQGWDMSIHVDGCRIVEATTEGTVAAPVAEGGIRRGGFEYTDITSGGYGTVSTVVLSNTGLVTLPSGSAGSTVLRLTLEGEAPASGCAASLLEFRDGEQSAGQPVRNRVSHDNLGYAPVLREASVDLCRGSSPVALILQRPETVELTGAHPEQLFTFSATPGTTVVLALTDPVAEHANALYVRWGEPPTPSLFDHAADLRGEPGQRLAIPHAQGTQAFVLVVANDPDDGAREITLSARTAGVAVQSLLPEEGASGSTAHVAIVGAGFDEETAFSLVSDAGTRVEAVDVRILAEDGAEVLWDLAGVEPGAYSIEVSKTGFPPEHGGGFMVLPSAADSILEVSIDAIERYRHDTIAHFTVSYANVGDREMPAPLLKIVATEGVQMRFETDPVYRGSELQALGTHPGGVPGWLPPGGRGEISIVYRTSHCMDCQLKIQVYVFTPNVDAHVGWDVLDPPEGMERADWDRAWPRLSLALGASWAEYARGLGDFATRLRPRGIRPYVVSDIFRFAVREALGRPSSAVVGRVWSRDSWAPLPGASLIALEGESVASSVRSDAWGRYALDWLEAGGRYRVVVLDHDVGGVWVDVPEGGDLRGLDLFAVASSEVEGIVPGCSNCDEQGLPDRPLAPPHPLFSLKAEKEVAVLSSWDPNQKDGPRGEGDEREISPRNEIRYEVHFENDGTLPAQKVKLVDRLDPSLDWTTFRFGVVQIGREPDQRLFLSSEEDLVADASPAGNDGYSSLSSLQVSIEKPETTQVVDVDVERYLDLETGIATWIFDSIGVDPFGGFLVKNDAAGQGEGYVSFTIRAKKDVPDRTKIVNDAEIRFDRVDPERTNAWTNTLRTFVPLTHPPVLPIPVDASGPVPGEPRVDVDAVLQWEPVQGAVAYDLFFWREGAEKTLVAEGLFLPFWDPPGDLDSGASYHWQVVARGADEVTLESPEWSFRSVLEVSPPQAPIQLAVAPDGSFADPLPRLEWEPAEGAASYEVYLWRAGEVRPQEPIVQGIINPFYDVREELVAGASYEWVVVATNSEGEAVGKPAGGPEGTPSGFTVEPPPEVPHRRGDANDDGSVDIGDVVRGLLYLFGFAGVPECLDAVDANDDGRADISDPVFLLRHLFNGASAPASPFPECGPDPTIDPLGCGAYRACP